MVLCSSGFAADSGRFVSLPPSLLSLSLFGDQFAREDAQVVREHDPTQFLTLGVQAFGEAAAPLVVVGDDGHARFGLGAAGLARPKVRVLHLFCQFHRGSGTDVIHEVGTITRYFFSRPFITKSSVRTHFLEFCANGFFGGFKGSKKKFGVRTDVFKKVPVNDQAITVFAKQEGVAVFHFRSAFTSYENLRNWLVDA